ncbi:MAG: magnesium transporter CorA family protein [Paludibacteraceae bacterium]|jgi:magnesium transporter|nr:magnesium transporter CorA family protein [Paludibacteraceae bacterium]OQA50301.1 MAG: Magnesium transport protein CorA [Bacteroidetes bacterium ADurb.Bin302]HOH96279.1 magnesium transporter CorA family protein [Candidatus Enterocola sp.]HPG54996.1 magnesium transporter CorA family protein [Candidatus Enterocola sp.]
MRTFLKNGNGLIPCQQWEPNCWVNVVKPTQNDADYIINELHVPSAFYEDIEDMDERPRIEVEDGWCFILMRIPCKEMEDPNSVPYTTVPLGIIFKDDVFVSVCFYQTDLITDFIQYTKRKNIERTDNLNFVFRLLLSSSIWFLKYLKQINNRTKIAEKQLENSIRNEDLQALLKLEKCLVYFTTSLRGNEILTHRLKNLRNTKDLYDPELVEDVEIESKQALEMTNIYSDILSGMMDAYASVISNNLNVVMKRLTTISIVLMMPTLIASYFGMNLESGTTIFNWTFLIVIITSILITAFTTGFFIKKRWF